jgi:hypothetical protein
MDAPVMYVVRFWVAPEGQQALFAWLDGGHNAEVVAQPGFLFVKRLKLEQKSDDGWDSYMMIYGLESRQALEDYFANTELAEKFKRERAPFIEHLRMDRAWGAVELSLAH